MTEQHPITPPPELVLKWMENAGGYLPDEWYYESNIADQAARWGADQELEACCEWLRSDLDAYELVRLRAVYLDHKLHAARRPPAIPETIEVDGHTYKLVK